MKFISRYSNGKEVSPAQYIAELICEHKADKEKKDLHYRFWLNKEWASYYRNQIGSANQLVKKYNPVAIVKALQDTRAKKIYSLRAPHLLPIIDEYQTQQDLINQHTNTSPNIDRTDNKTFRTIKKQNNILSKLEELDNGT